jgi:flagellar FliJ protein
MRRFSFRLEKVLELRQYREQETKTELGRAIGILNEIEHNIQINAARHSQAVRERFSGIHASAAGVSVSSEALVSSENPDTFGIRSMLEWDNYIHRLEQEAQRLAEEAERAEQVVEEKRNLYLEASRELKIMEKLKEKRKTEYRREMFAAETSELDDRKYTQN